MPNPELHLRRTDRLKTTQTALCKQISRSLEWDCKLETAEMQGEQVPLRFAGGKTALADIAIGSDGANSRLRELVTPIRPEYVGVSLVEGLVPAAKQTIPELWDLLGGSELIALGGERPIDMGTKPEGSVLIYAGLNTHDGTARRSLEEASGPDQRVAGSTPTLGDGVSRGTSS